MTPDEATLREQYSRSGAWKPFEHAAARFRPADLAYLLEGGDRLRLTYLIDEGAEPWRGEELRQWVATGLISMVARKALNSGYTPHSLDAAAAQALAMDNARSREGWRETLAAIPNGAEYLRDCASAALSPEWLDAGLQSRIPVVTLAAVRDLGVPHRYARPEIVGPLGDAVAARAWYLAGVSPWAAGRFAAAHIDAESATTWLRAGYVPDEILEFAARMIWPDSARAFANKPAFSKAFRRTGDGVYSMRRVFASRVEAAIEAMDVPAAYKSSMYSTATWRRSFLDGGYVSVSGYGFGSRSYACVLGDTAVRFVCHRIGVRTPQTRRGEVAGPSMLELEEMLHDQRMNQWDDLLRVARAR